jgi:hypothetical protein
MTDNRSVLELMPEQREDLQRWAQSRTLPAGHVFRPRLILALAAGKSYREIESGMQTSAATIARWRVRFERDGLAWTGRPSPGHPAAYGDGGGASAGGATGTAETQR